MAIGASSRIGLRFTAGVISAIWTFHAALAASAAPDQVSLSEQTVHWSTVKYATSGENGFVNGSLDKNTIVDRTFKGRVLENRYLKVVLLPEFGGRILSIIYKPTGHEQLYRTEVGVPYGMGEGNFYYDWLMVYGGIFPTFPDAEHGRTWPKPWDFKVVKESADEVTVSMSLTDNFEYPAAPEKFSKGSSGIEATYHVTLKADRAAVDARLVLKNPNDKTIPYEYWTCTTLAPGSDPNNPKTTGGAEIIAPVAAYRTPAWSKNIAEGDASAGAGTTRFAKLRYFKNWPTMGIAYAAPDMQGGNFWGVINHDNEEGIIRIADNTITRGLKMWTWGFASFTNETDQRKDPNPARPYVELWAGVSDEFFHSAEFPARSEVSIPETYSPTVGMSNVTHANANILINLVAEASGATLQFFSIEPVTPLRIIMKRSDAVLFDDAVTADPKNGNRIFAPIPAGNSAETVQLTIRTSDGKELIAAAARIEARIK
ncbi:DUF5107 domain-containing protein [Bradyrhizobium sp. AUGA SZCCT0177]|uniref:DUF5107 domain-containing protein n=1 Tax=unclassified Bradyrhizobium TaxID=2631580 RepID=UPI001BA65DF4|nr:MULTISPECIES: DUF5107 domain-containing protein [unclassified Bradyrhizobium]MBR1237845.1 DUF5107 domain-containing protein [Bradyrhizobium sp. AUGA SZCCT0182]MBR1285912.1 DUF5107 domain-containing protein [Bradyrhizobium sp. AUGA SZCCT0177]